MNTTEAERQWVVDHLGHTVDVHRVHYRQTSDVIERVDVAKLLLIQDLGLVGKFKGMRLQDIQLNGEYITLCYLCRETKNKYILTLLCNYNDNTIEKTMKKLYSSNYKRIHFVIRIQSCLNWLQQVGPFRDLFIIFYRTVNSFEKLFQSHCYRQLGKFVNIWLEHLTYLRIS